MENEISDVLPHVSSPFLDQAAGKPVAYPDRFINAKLRCQKRSPFVSLAAITSIFAILIIWSLCTAARSRDLVAGVTRRRVSDSEGIDEDEQSVLDDCLALEDELGIHRSEEPSPFHGDRSSRIAQLASLFSETAMAFESRQRMTREWMQATQGPWEYATSPFTMPAEVPMIPHEQYPAPQGAASSYYGEHAYWQGAALHTPAQGFGSGDILSALDPNAWIDPTTITTGMQGDWGQGQSAWASGEQPSSAPTQQALRAHSAGSAGNEQQTADSAVQSSEEGTSRSKGCEDTDSHPYVRVPTLDPGVVPRDFRTPVVFEQPLKSMMIHIPLCTLRRLFLKKTLNQEEADAVVGAAEYLARAAWIDAHLYATILNPNFAIERLGKQVLAFDALVCAIKLLGDSMKQHEWWEEFVLAFYTEYTFIVPETARHRKPRMAAKIANRLLGALNLYKTGERPPNTEVIALKRLLFSSSYAPREFQEAPWDPWREDDERHAVHEHLSG